MNTKGSESTGTSDESIGRPDEWREGRYQQPGKPVDLTKKTDVPPSPDSVPVTRKDYE
jgi:hypothetical protein